MGLAEPSGSNSPEAEPADGAGDDRLSVVIGILLAVVAVTAALAAWRTTAVGGQVSDTDRAAMIEVSQLEAIRHIIEDQAYGEAGYAVDVRQASAEATTLGTSGLPDLAAAAGNMSTYLIPGMEALAGPFATDGLTTPQGTLDVAGRISALMEQDATFQSVDPEATFATADDYANEKRALTVLSLVLAIALFWLGMAEITRGRWRITNLVIGVAIWVVAIAAFGVVELAFIASRGGAL